MGARMRISPSPRAPRPSAGPPPPSAAVRARAERAPRPRRAAIRRRRRPSPSRSCRRWRRRWRAASSGALLPPRRTQVKTEGSSRRSAVATSETCDDPARAPGLFDGLGLEARAGPRAGVPVDDRTGHDGQAADVRQRQAGQPDVTGGVDAEPGRWSPRADAATASWVSTTPLGVPDVPDVATTSASPSSTADAVGQRVLLAVRADDPRRAQRVEQHLRAARGQPGVERSRGIAGVPDGPQCIDEADATGKVECDELRHRPVA